MDLRALAPHYESIAQTCASLVVLSRFPWIRYVFDAILIYSVHTDPLIVYTSNIFAILGLRAT